jgi:hypothetical protein
MAPDSTEKVLERLATSDKVTIVVERLLNRNMHVTSGSWDNEKVILHDEVIEVRNVDAACSSRASRGGTTSGTRMSALRSVWSRRASVSDHAAMSS